MSTDYSAFIESKRRRAPARGLTASTQDVSPLLHDWQRAVCVEALERGRYAVFADTGLGKTRIQIEWARIVAERTGGRVLIVAPLAVNRQTIREGALLGVAIADARALGDLGDAVSITNYDRIHLFADCELAGLVLDESSILKQTDGATRRAIQARAESVPYRLACTATPAPNEPTELATHSEFLGEMRVIEILSRFFIHQEPDVAGGESKRYYRLKRHAVRDWYEYLSSWSVALRKPSDLDDGYSDDGYILPELRTEVHLVDTGGVAADGRLFGVEAQTLSERREAKRDSVSERVETIRALVAAEPDEQWLVWCNLNVESEALRRALPGAVEVRGSDDPDDKADRLLGFADGTHRVLVTKPSIGAHGLNLQRCARVAFCGLSDSWEQYYQAVRRCHRYGQTRPVHVHIVASQAEASILRNIERKERQATKMMDAMIDETGVLRTGRDYTAPLERDDAAGLDWRLMLGDSAERLGEIEEESVGLSVFSPPFPGMYLYSASPHDVGNARTIEDLVEHVMHICGAPLLRVTMPGRLCCLHMMQLPASLAWHGWAGIQDWRGPTIASMQQAGWEYAGEVTIDKDPQVQATRHKVHGLLFKTLANDSSAMRMALADYLLYFRKPGDNPEPIHAGTHPVYNPDGGWITQQEWIEWAAPVWYSAHRGVPGGIKETDILNPRVARDKDDERHLCPLQLGVIERAVKLWSAPGDLVLSPFAGIGSEGVVALRHNRRFVGVELKRSYFQQAARNLENARSQLSLDIPTAATVAS